MSHSPHTPEFLTKVSQKYLEESSYPFLAKKYNIGKITLQQWAAKYRLYGIAFFSEILEIPLIYQISKRCVWKRFCQEMEA